MKLFGKMESVTLAAVFATSYQREAIRQYSMGQNKIRLVAVASGGEELLVMLRQGMRPDAILIDTLIKDVPIFALLRKIRMIPDYDPKIFVVGPEGCSGNLRELLLTSGANYIMLGVYRLPILFREIVRGTVEQGEWQQYQAITCYEHLMDEMHAGNKLYGRKYLEWALCICLNENELLSMEQLYRMIGDRAGISPGAVNSALHRLAVVLRDADTEPYLKLCTNHGKERGTVLSNSELVGGVVGMVRVRL